LGILISIIGGVFFCNFVSVIEIMSNSCFRLERRAFRSSK
jgi:hypothetical protein